LLARMRAVMRRDRRPTGPATIPKPESARAGWEVDHRRHEIRWRGQPLAVTAIEYRLLTTLVERLGELVKHDELLAAGWPDTTDPDPLWLKPHLARLREKLGVAGAPAPVAVRGVGYRLDPAVS
jgi:two-component system, OmpR family, phosphate regulon response regulator PhoB